MIQFESFIWFDLTHNAHILPNFYYLTQLLKSNLTQNLRLILAKHLWFNLNHFSDLILLPLHPFHSWVPIWIIFYYSIWLILSNLIQLNIYDSIWPSYTILFEINCTHLNHSFQFDSDILNKFDSEFTIQFGSVFMIQFDSVIWFFLTNTTSIWLTISESTHFYDSIWLTIYNPIQLKIYYSILLTYRILFETHCTH